VAQLVSGRFSFMPPKGHCGVAGTGSLTPMVPASSPSAIFHATVRSFVNTYRNRLQRRR
jgi:hypothetical protein